LVLSTGHNGGEPILRHRFRKRIALAGGELDVELNDGG